MSRDKLIGEMNHLMKATKEELVKNGAVPQTVFIEVGDDVLIALLDYKNDEQKNSAINAVRLLIDQSDADAAYHVSEMWVSLKNLDGKPIDLGSLPAPSQDPKREEMLLIVAVSKCSQGIVALEQRFSRSKKGEIIFGESKVWEPFYHKLFSGLFGLDKIDA